MRAIEGKFSPKSLTQAKPGFSPSPISDGWCFPVSITSKRTEKITYFWGSLESLNPNPSPVHSFPDFPLVRVRAFDPKTRRDDEKTCAKIPSEFKSETAMSGYADDILNS